MIVENDILPFRGFIAMNIFGIVFVRRDSWNKLSGMQQDALLQHETIHTEQMRELGYLGFYILYFLEWVYRLIFHTKTAYRGISFELEAYDHEHDYGYLFYRIPYAQWRRK